MARAGTRRAALVAAVLVGLVVLVAGCGGQGSGTLPSRTPSARPPSPSPSASPTASPPASPTRSPTGSPSSRPTVERPTRTEQPRPTATKPPTTKPPTTPPSTSKPPTTKPPTTPPSTSKPPTTKPPTKPAPAPSPTKTTTILASPEPSPSPSSLEPTTATATPAPTAATTTESDTVPAWVWWLLAALVIAAAVSVPLIVRARRHARWRADLATAEAEVAWLARELLPQLRRAGSLDGVAGGWSVAEPRVVTAEDRLAVLESSAFDQAGRDRAHGLLDAVRGARAGMQTLTAAGPDETWVLDLDAIIDALEHALAVPEST